MDCTLDSTRRRRVFHITLFWLSHFYKATKASSSLRPEEEEFLCGLMVIMWLTTLLSVAKALLGGSFEYINKMQRLAL